jgi:hypothetical protein
MERIIEIFDEFNTKHHSKHLLEWDLKSYLAQKEEAVRDEYSGVRYDEIDLDERYDEGVEDGREELVSDIERDFARYFGAAELEELRTIFSSEAAQNLDNPDNVDNIKLQLKNILDDFLSYVGI